MCEVGKLSLQDLDALAELLEGHGAASRVYTSRPLDAFVDRDAANEWVEHIKRALAAPSSQVCQGSWVLVL